MNIYRKMTVAPSARVRVKYPRFANIGLSVARMLKIARAGGAGSGGAAESEDRARYRAAGAPAGRVPPRPKRTSALIM